ncbi:MAG: very-short-patch-repair endonuclease [Parasphingorhabdus sp.]|uniref:endonuclease domain-containing protein n=1 Tax=Parasphingorhabdus sp. TaxID=2709688 RepID=UPI0039E2EA9A
MPVFKPRNTNRARSLRNEATPAERKLWKYLSKRQVDGRKFSRQMPIGPYYADFLCRELALIIEIDGYSHDMRQSEDATRTQDLIDHGYRIVRFTNDDVLINVEGVVRQIELAIANIPTPNPSRKREGNQ